MLGVCKQETVDGVKNGEVVVVDCITAGVVGVTMVLMSSSGSDAKVRLWGYQCKCKKV